MKYKYVKIPEKTYMRFIRYYGPIDLIENVIGEVLDEHMDVMEK